MNTKNILILGGAVFLLYFFVFRKSAAPYWDEAGFVGPIQTTDSAKGADKNQRRYSSTNKKR